MTFETPAAFWKNPRALASTLRVERNAAGICTVLALVCLGVAALVSDDGIDIIAGVFGLSLGLIALVLASIAFPNYFLARRLFERGTSVGGRLIELKTLRFRNGRFAYVGTIAYRDVERRLRYLKVDSNKALGPLGETLVLLTRAEEGKHVAVYRETGLVLGRATPPVDETSGAPALRDTAVESNVKWAQRVLPVLLFVWFAVHLYQCSTN